MTNIFQIRDITKDEFISILETVVEAKIIALRKTDTNKYVTVQEVAKTLSVSELTIYSYIKKGILPAKKFGRKYKIDSDDLDKVLQDVKSLKYKRDV